MRYGNEEYGEEGGFTDLEYLATELEGCPSKRTMRWMLERMEEDSEVDGEEWK
jgi:hypothetical protein